METEELVGLVKNSPDDEVTLGTVVSFDGGWVVTFGLSHRTTGGRRSERRAMVGFVRDGRCVFTSGCR